MTHKTIFGFDATQSQHQRLVSLHSPAWTWWRNQIGTLSALLALCAGNSPVTGEVPSQRPLTQSFDVFIDRCLNKRLIKQSWAGYLGRNRAHYDVTVMNIEQHRRDGGMDGRTDKLETWDAIALIITSLWWKTIIEWLKRKYSQNVPAVSWKFISSFAYVTQ